jgi:hypothetical protein
VYGKYGHSSKRECLLEDNRTQKALFWFGNISVLTMNTFTGIMKGQSFFAQGISRFAYGFILQFSEDYTDFNNTENSD